jgi:hypothetical protein
MPGIESAALLAERTAAAQRSTRSIGQPHLLALDKPLRLAFDSGVPTR